VIPVDKRARSWRTCVLFLPVACSLAILGGSATAQTSSSSLAGQDLIFDGNPWEIPFVEAGGGTYRNDGHVVYRIKSLDTDRALIVDFRYGMAGSVPADRLVPVTGAVQYFSEKIRANPQSSLDYDLRGFAWRCIGNADKSIIDSTEVIRLRPAEGAGYNNRAIAWILKHEFDIAIADLNDAIRFDPKHVRYRRNRGIAWMHEERYDKAILDFEKALELNPSDKEALALRSYVWSCCPVATYRDGKRAVEAATKACKLSEWKGYESLDALAAAHAEVGDFGKALEFEKQALGLIGPVKTANQKGYAKRLALYEKKQPFRFDPDDVHVFLGE
jgi:tetratricopeptide (TPR) repeat protein